MHENISEIIARDRVVRVGFENVTEHFFRNRIFATARVNLPQVYADAGACTTRRRRGLIEFIFVAPVTAADRAANAQGKDCDRCNGSETGPELPWQVQRATAEAKQEADAWQVKPMLRHGRVQLHDIRDRKIGGKKPDRAHDTRSLTDSASGAAVDERREYNQSENREIFGCDCLPPTLAAEVIVGIENGALHVQVPRKDHQPTVVTQRAQHQRAPNGSRPVFGERLLRSRNWKPAQFSICAKHKRAANDRRNLCFFADVPDEDKGVDQKNEYPNTSDFTGAKRQHYSQCRQRIKDAF